MTCRLHIRVCLITTIPTIPQSTVNDPISQKSRGEARASSAFPQTEPQLLRSPFFAHTDPTIARASSRTFQRYQTPRQSARYRSNGGLYTAQGRVQRVKLSFRSDCTYVIVTFTQTRICACRFHDRPRLFKRFPTVPNTKPIHLVPRLWRAKNHARGGRGTGDGRKPKIRKPKPKIRKP